MRVWNLVQRSAHGRFSAGPPHHDIRVHPHNVQIALHDPVTPKRQTGSKDQLKLIRGMNQFYMVPCLAAHPCAQLGELYEFCYLYSYLFAGYLTFSSIFQPMAYEICTFIYNKTGFVFTCPHVSKCTKVMNLTKKKSSTKTQYLAFLAHKRLQARNFFEHVDTSSFWCKQYILGAYVLYSRDKWTFKLSSLRRQILAPLAMLVSEFVSANLGSTL